MFRSIIIVYKINTVSNKNLLYVYYFKVDYEKCKRK